MENKNKYNSVKNKKTGIGSSSSVGKKQNSTYSTNKFGVSKQGGQGQSRSRVLSLTQLLSRIRKQRGVVPVVTGFGRNTGSNSVFSQGNNFTSISINNNRSFSAGKGQNQTVLNEAYGVVEGVSQKQDLINRNLLQNKQGQFSQKDQTGISPYFAGVSSRREGMQSRMDYKEEQKRQKPIKPIIPPKSLVIILKEKPEKILYNRRIIDYKHCGLLQRYIGLGGKILPRRQTRLTAKQQRYIAKTIKSARIMGLLPFVSKEKGFFR